MVDGGVGKNNRNDEGKGRDGGTRGLSRQWKGGRGDAWGGMGEDGGRMMKGQGIRRGRMDYKKK